MSIDELEAEALKLAPAARARLAERLLESLETLSDEENARLWADEAQRRMVVSFHELARLELNEAARYYESESTGLGAGVHHRSRAMRQRDRSVSRGRRRCSRLDPSPSDTPISVRCSVFARA
jgi:hypothetical protein